jgi:hypothetical protein
MDIVDKLRRTGLNGIVELPQLVACGDQSSGKSPVLEATTEIPFLRKENLCARFVTEVGTKTRAWRGEKIGASCRNGKQRAKLD